ncbi:hypothetical protein [Wolbachia endosymbiont of Cantharis cryptica]|uniref:hypothetical protein n=1 Tax=Wolbachia endosymbiont of Cantharis cryptica TaxID=3066132 RepID=UPI00376EF7B6
MKEEAKKMAKTGLKMAYSKFPEGAQDLWDKHAPSPLQVKEGLTMGEEAIEKEASGLEFKSDNLIRKLFNIDEASITLRKALSVFEKEWILLYLDRSLEEVRRGTKTEEQHNQYFSSIRNKDILKLSLDHHSDRKADKQEEGVEGNQRIINDLKEALKNIHNYVIENKSIHENRVVYRLFEDVPVKDIVNQDAFKVANTVANCELSSLAFWEGETLMKERNKYLNNVRTCLKSRKDKVK